MMVIKITDMTVKGTAPQTQSLKFPLSVRCDDLMQQVAEIYGYEPGSFIFCFWKLEESNVVTVCNTVDFVLF